MLNISTATEKGPREFQEDRFVVVSTDDGDLLAVADGHGGSEVAEYVVERLETIWWRVSYLFPDATDRLKQTVARLNYGTEELRSGSTLSLAFIPHDVPLAYISILGDSPVVSRSHNGMLDLSPDHNVRSNPKERVAAESRGGLVLGGYLYAHFSGSGLQMTRSLGDSELARVLNREPEVYCVPFWDFLLVASDGLFDPTHQGSALKQAEEFAKLIDAGASAQDLVNVNLSEADDNVTAVLWKRE